MAQVLVYILGFAAIVVGLSLFFGVASIALAALSVVAAKAVKTGKHSDDFFLSLAGVVLFCVAISITVLLGSSFLRIFASLFFEFPQSDEAFESDILNISVSFGMNVCIGMVAGLVGWRWFPPIIASALMPLFYLASDLMLSVVVAPKLWIFFSPSELTTNLSDWLEGILNALNLLISPSVWGGTFHQLLLDGGGNILVFEPFFAMAIIVVAIIEILSGLGKADNSVARIDRSALKTTAISLGVFFVGLLIFLALANGTFVPDNPPLWLAVIVGLIGLPLQLISFVVFIIAFVVFVVSAFTIFPLSLKNRLFEGFSAN